MAAIHPLKVSPDGTSWWPDIETGETAPSVPQSMSASAVSKSQINVSWAAPASPGDMSEYKLYRGGTLIQTSTATSRNDTGLSSSTTYTYTVYGVTPGGKLGPGASASATTQAGTQQKVVTLSPTSGGSYNGSGNRRWGIGGGSYYSGYYSSNHGRQFSCFHYAVPSDLRNCVSVDKVEFTLQNDHWFNASGGTQYIAISHTQTAGSTNPGSTGLFGAKTSTRDGWWGGSQWQDITNLREPNFNDTVAGNFRTRGAWGIHIKAPDNNQAYYGYWRNNPVPQIRFTYTINV